MPIIKRFFPGSKKSYFLFGPRGTGKSTYLKHLYANRAIWIDLLKPEEYRSYIARPERLDEIIQGQPEKSVIIIDEIQKAPGLLSVIHHWIERKKNLQFILTGSSARKLKRTRADLLGGRALKHSLHPFMASELGALFSLEQALTFGLLPLVFFEKDPADLLQAYISLYLQEEIHAEGLVRNLENFSRFLEIASFSHAAVLNTTNIARECEIKRKTVENYLQILEDLLLAYRIPVFDKKAQRQLISHPKFYLFDSGVFNTLRPKGPLDLPEEIHGAALEGLVAHHLKTWIDYSVHSKQSLYFWRTRAGLEVDFIVYGPQGFWAIEVKNAKKVHDKDLKSLIAFLEDYPQATALLLYRGTEYLRIKNILCIPCGDFLKQIVPDQALWAE